jgi:glutaredoxin
VSNKYGVLQAENGVPNRTIFVIDKEGIIRTILIYEQMEQPDNAVLFAEMARLEPARAAIMAAKKVEEEEDLPTGGVVLYCTRWCPSCVKARKWLLEHGIDYVEVNVGSSGKAAEQVKIWAGGNRTTPTLDLDGTVVVGWDEAKVAEILLGK